MSRGVDSEDERNRRHWNDVDDLDGDGRDLDHRRLRQQCRLVQFPTDPGVNSGDPCQPEQTGGDQPGTQRTPPDVRNPPTASRFGC
jgi:hypothetical protein